MEAEYRIKITERDKGQAEYNIIERYTRHLDGEVVDREWEGFDKTSISLLNAMTDIVFKKTGVFLVAGSNSYKIAKSGTPRLVSYTDIPK